MKGTIRILTVLLGIFSLVSFTQRLFDIGIVAIAIEIIDYYRTIAYFFIGLPARIFGFSFPEPLMDMWTLSFIGAGAYIKTSNIEDSRFFRRYPALTEITHWKYWLFTVFGLTGIGFFILWSSISPKTYVDDFHEEPLDLSKATAKNVMYILVGTIVFFVINAFTPTI